MTQTTGAPNPGISLPVCWSDATEARPVHESMMDGTRVNHYSVHCALEYTIHVSTWICVCVCMCVCVHLHSCMICEGTCVYLHACVYLYIIDLKRSR